MPGDQTPACITRERAFGAAFLLLLLFLGGCATTAVTERPRTADTGARPSSPNPYATRIKTALYAQHAAWRGTPYRLGGLSRNGIDCSGLVYATFRQQFGRHLPRTTGAQARAGQPVGRSDLRPGDLLFFRLGGGRRHVGIYLENDTFLHASSSQGVTLSSLDDPYWASGYWQARRVLDFLAER